jgi:hypothetical protein
MNLPSRLSLSSLLALAATAPSLFAQDASLVQSRALASVAPLLSDAQASSVQSKANPFGLSIVDQVMVAGSDDRSATFQKELLPSITDLLNKNLSERTRFATAGSFALDPTKLRLSVDSTARVYFLGEGAGYRNTLGFNTLAPGEGTPKESLTKSAQLIFPDASSTVSTFDPAVAAKRTSTAPLLPGDFVDLGKFGAGTTLDFFLVANGAGGGRDIWTAPASRNADGFDHVVAFALPESPYLIIGFEDLRGGGDRDFNDVLFAVDIGAVNVQRLLSTPEPAAWLSLLSLGAVAWLMRRRLAAA